ncbi:hypothetical protein E0H80_16460 [Acinetobacter sp. ANC 4779]|uniref:hypothetical protein n=1 Tax=Acinetobacter sp. ANC 4779 TaxID=2529848 RepID=UPI00103AB3B6|nr:hypothetical protein [Acinetobacter sp. ANC 4779]TCB47013.1 hypothetical protein E0H80_16460 [Acinetobacter sp. ANC 4779]
MKKLKVYYYITSIGISLFITEMGSRIHDYLVQKIGYNWALMISIMIVISILFLGYFLIEKVNDMFLELEKEGFKNDFSKVAFYLILLFMSIIIVLAMSSLIY